MLPWQRAPDNATSKYRNNSTLAKNDFGRLFLSRAHFRPLKYYLTHFFSVKLGILLPLMCKLQENLVS